MCNPRKVPVVFIPTDLLLPSQLSGGSMIQLTSFQWCEMSPVQDGGGAGLSLQSPETDKQLLAAICPQDSQHDLSSRAVLHLPGLTRA